MKKIISFALSAMFILSAFASCTEVTQNSRITSSDGLEKYADYLEMRLGNSFPERIVLETEEDFHVDMGDFRKDGFIVRKNGNDAVIIGKSAEGVDRGVRYYANYCTDVDVADYSYGEGYRVKKITIADRDISEYSIYLFPDADECHTYAATELQKYISLACGAELPIVREKASPMIAFERVLEDSPEYEALGDEGFRISVNNGDLHITGGKWRGCMYGAFEVLELIGWRFFGNWEVVDFREIPEEDFYYLYESEQVNIPADYEDTQIPSFAYRKGRSPLPSEYDVKLKENHDIRASSKFNGYGYCIGACHGLANGPVKAGLFEDYSTKSGCNPCFTNEDYIEISIDYYSNEIEEKLKLGQEVGREIVDVDVAQCDLGKFCACSECLKYVKRDGSNTGPVLYFTNRMAEALGDKYSGIYVSMLSYWGTTKPPKTTMPLKNVNVSYCFYNDIGKNACYNHGLGEDNCDLLRMDNYGCNLSNKTFKEEFLRWCEIAETVTVWYYPGQWCGEIIPFGSLKHILNDFKFFAENDVYGVWPCMLLNPKGAEPIALSADYVLYYLIDEVQWNVNISEEEYWAKVEEYYYVVYGDGADSIVDYQRWLIDAAQPGCWSAMGCSFPTDRFNFDKAREDFEYCVGLIDRALDLAPTEEQYYGVELFSRGVLYSGLCAAYNSWYADGTAQSRERYVELYERFKELAVRTGLEITDTLTEEDFDISQNPVYLLFTLFNKKTEWIDSIK